MSTTQLIGPPPAVDSYPFAPGYRREGVEDLFLFLDRPVAPPVRLDTPTASSSWSLGSTPNFRFLDDTGAVVFDAAAAAYTTADWGSGFVLHRWEVGDESLVILVREEAGLSLPDSGVLDERTWDSARPALTSLVVNGQEVDAGRVVFESGYNLDLTAAGGRITVAATPGGGSGVVEDCTPTRPPLRTVSRVAPDRNGNLRLSANDCLAITAAPARLTVRGDCPQCAPCAAFENVYKALKKIDVKGADLGSRASTIRDAYAEAVSRWNAEKACRESRPLKVTAVAYAAGTRRCAAIMVTFCNSTKVCLVDMTLALHWVPSRPGLTADVYPNSTTIYRQNGLASVYTLSGAWPDWSAGWGSVDAGRTVRLKFSVCFDGELPGDFADLTATVSAAGRPAFAVDTVRVIIA